LLAEPSTGTRRYIVLLRHGSVDAPESGRRVVGVIHTVVKCCGYCWVPGVLDGLWLTPSPYSQLEQKSQKIAIADDHDYEDLSFFCRDNISTPTKAHRIVVRDDLTFSSYWHSGASVQFAHFSAYERPILVNNQKGDKSFRNKQM